MVNSSLNKRDKILILGIGNYLMGDEGIGVHIAHQLEKRILPENVDVLDGGVGGFHLLSYLQDYPQVIMIDATIKDKPTGTVDLIQPKFSSDFPKGLSAHDIGLKDLVESAILLGHLPKMHLITISIASNDMEGIRLTEPVQNAIEEVISLVYQLIG
jgi:hydrogenase maturation protease